MKAILAAVLLSMLLVVPATAGQGAIQIGLKGGVNMASIERETDDFTDESLSNRLGWGAGAVLSVLASPTLSFDMDLLYLQRGAQVEQTYREGSEEGSLVTFDTDTRLDYFVVAPMLRLTARRPSFAPYLLFGGEFGYLIDAQAQTTSSRDAQSSDVQSDGSIKEHFKETDLGITVGGGFEMPASSYAFFLEGRYSLGLTDIGNDSEGDAIAQKHRGVYLFGGLRF